MSIAFKPWKMLLKKGYSMSCEYYDLEWCGTRLHTKVADATSFNLNDDLKPAGPIHSCLGDDNKIWCAVYREQSGGMFIIRDFDHVLLVARAKNNMTFLAGLNYFAGIVSNSRYGADIFEHNDDEDE